MKIGVGYHNGIGNFVIFTSILRCLEYYSGNPVDLILDEKWTQNGKKEIINIAKNCSFIDEIIDYPSQFEPEKYDSIYMSRHSVFSDEFHLYVHGEKELNLAHYTTWCEDYYHEIDYYFFELQNQFNYKGPIFKQWMPYAEFSDKASESLRIVISNGWQRTISGFWKCKSYPHWIKVIKVLEKIYSNCSIFLIGDNNDKEWAKKVKSETNCTDMTGKLNILETAGLILQSDILLSTDTSVFHIADALNVPGVILFGPTLISKNGPLNDSIIPIRSPLQCSPCQGSILVNTCPDTSSCMKDIDPGMVIAAARKQIKKHSWPQ